MNKEASLEGSGKKRKEKRMKFYEDVNKDGIGERATKHSTAQHESCSNARGVRTLLGKARAVLASSQCRVSSGAGGEEWAKSLLASSSK